MTPDLEREEFEAWNAEEFENDNPYANTIPSMKEHRWKVWQARAALSQPAAAGDMLICLGCGHLGPAPTGEKVISCCPERQPVTIKALFNKWVDLDTAPPAAAGAVGEAAKLVDLYDKAMASQEGNGPDAKLMVMANYGELALNLLRTAAPSTSSAERDNDWQPGWGYSKPWTPSERKPR